MARQGSDGARTSRPKRAAAGLVGALAAGLAGIGRITAPTPGSKAVADYGKLPLVFEPNVGQADARKPQFHY